MPFPSAAQQITAAAAQQGLVARYRLAAVYSAWLDWARNTCRFVQQRDVWLSVPYFFA